MSKIPTVLKSQVVHKNKYQEIKVDTLELDGKRWEQSYFVKPNKNGVGILPIDEAGIYLVNQYRHASRAFLWQIPMGMVDPDSTEIETAKKELLEEAGLLAETITSVGSIFAEPGMSNQEEFMYVATGIKKKQQHLEDTELGMRVKHFSFKEIEEMVKNGDIKCGFTLSALELYHNNYL